MSLANWAESSSLDMACPPNLTTTTSPRRAAAFCRVETKALVLSAAASSAGRLARRWSAGASGGCSRPATAKQEASAGKSAASKQPRNRISADARAISQSRGAS